MSDELNFQVVGYRVLAKPVEEKAEEKETNGIIIPASVAERDPRNEFEVLAVGQPKVDINGNVTPIPVDVGYKILIQPGSGCGVKLNGKVYFLYNVSEILGIYK